MFVWYEENKRKEAGDGPFKKNDLKREKIDALRTIQ